VGTRYLKARRSSSFLSKITLISVAGVAVGVWALIVVLSVMSGFEEDLRDKIIGSNAHGNLVKIMGPFTEYNDMIDKIVKATPEVEAMSPFILREVMITSENNVTGAVLKGIDVDSSRKVNDLQKYLDANLCFPNCGKVKGEVPKSKALQYLKDEKLLFDETRPPDLFNIGPPKKKPPQPPEKEIETAEEELKIKKENSAKEELKEAEARAFEAKKKIDALAAKLDKPSDDVPAYKKVVKRVKDEVLPCILIGHEMAKFLSAFTGDVINVVDPIGGGMGPTGPLPSKQAYRVAGIFYSGMFEYDMKFAYATLESVQKLSDSGSSITAVEYRLKRNKINDSHIIADKIEKLVGRFPFEARDWKDMNRSLLAALKMERLAMFIILIFITLVAAFNIASTLIMMVLEKVKEISILKSMGASDAAVMRIFMLDGIIIGVIGLAIGLILGVVTCLIISQIGIPLDQSVYYMPTLPVKMDWELFIIVPVSTLFLCFVATIYPALRAAKQAPVDGLRNE